MISDQLQLRLRIGFQSNDDDNGQDSLDDGKRKLCGSKHTQEFYSRCEESALLGRIGKRQLNAGNTVGEKIIQGSGKKDADTPVYFELFADRIDEPG